jgi:hypothetical protein
MPNNGKAAEDVVMETWDERVVWVVMFGPVDCDWDVVSASAWMVCEWLLDGALCEASWARLCESRRAAHPMHRTSVLKCILFLVFEGEVPNDMPGANDQRREDTEDR